MIRSAVFVGLLVAAMPTVGTAAAGSITAGEQKIEMCASCHGTRGYSEMPDFPSLAGQRELYLRGQLMAYRSGKRSNDMMNGIAGGLDEQGIRDIAAYYASQPPKAVTEVPDKLTVAMKIQAEKSKDVYLQKCAGCHGREGTGQGFTPRISGQQADYMKTQFEAYRTGTRKSLMMQRVVGDTFEEQIDLVADYLSRFAE